MALLATGDFERGWTEYEWRWESEFFVKPNVTKPRWDGSPLEGRTLVITAEQGLGDTFQFVRYAPLAQKSGGRVIVVCQPALTRILASCPGIDQIVGQGS